MATVVSNVYPTELHPAKSGSPFYFGAKNAQPLENISFEGNLDVNGVETTKEVLET